MGFWGKLGKGLLKVAPIAAMAIPGLGPIASAAIQGGLGAANAKASGAGWKGVLGGAAAGAISSGKIKGLGPSAGVAAKGTAAKTGIKATLGNIAKDVGKNVATNAAMGLVGRLGQSNQGRASINQSSPQATRGLGPDLSNPNLANALNAGKSEAIRNQPFRRGYDVISQGPEPADDAMGNVGPEIRTPMPPIRSRRQYAY